MIEFLFLPPPPSMNEHYQPSRGRLILSQSARAYKHELGLELDLYHSDKIPKARRFKNKELIVFIDHVGPRELWYTKSGSIRKIDVDSANKSLIDVVFSFLNLDDSQIFLQKISKKVVTNCSKRHVELLIDVRCVQNKK